MPKVFSESLPPSADFPASLTVPPLSQDVIALARSTFASLENTDPKDIIIVGSGNSCPWPGESELSERTWESFYMTVSEAEVVFRSGVYPLPASEDSRKSLTTSLQTEKSSKNRDPERKKTPPTVVSL